MLVDTNIIIGLLILSIFLAGSAGGLTVSLLNEAIIKDRRLKERKKQIEKNKKNKYKAIDQKA